MSPEEMLLESTRAAMTAGEDPRTPSLRVSAAPDLPPARRAQPASEARGASEAMPGPVSEMEIATYSASARVVTRTLWASRCTSLMACAALIKTLTNT